MHMAATATLRPHPSSRKSQVLATCKPPSRLATRMVTHSCPAVVARPNALMIECPFAGAGNVASLPDNHLGAGQSAMKLRDDLFTAKNSADLLSEMLSGISIQDPADVKQV